MAEVALFRGPTNLASPASRASSLRYLASADGDVLPRSGGGGSSSPESPAGSTGSFGVQEQREQEVEGSEEEEEERWSFLALLLELLRKSLLGCRADGGDGGSEAGSCGMEIGWPTHVQHVAHVTFDRFHGFLGLPVELEPEVPRRAPSASEEPLLHSPVHSTEDKPNETNIAEVNFATSPGTANVAVKSMEMEGSSSCSQPALVAAAATATPRATTVNLIQAKGSRSLNSRRTRQGKVQFGMRNAPQTEKPIGVSIVSRINSKSPKRTTQCKQARHQLQYPPGNEWASHTEPIGFQLLQAKFSGLLKSQDRTK
ncbi:hypothetical protein ABZP36_011913 [Zizania latifolia]